MSEEPRERAFTTLEVARVCGAFHSTVLRWVEAGALRSWKTVSGSTRVSVSDLAAFMLKSGLPVPEDMRPSAPRVLIIDDEPLVTRQLERALGMGDRFLVVSANNPIEGLIEVGKHQPDVLILDLLMPMMSGYDVCRILKSGPATRSIRIVAMSAAEPTLPQRDFLEKNADLFLNKPFDNARLMKDLAALLD
jgi:excisionase family DNA binding protein